MRTCETCKFASSPKPDFPNLVFCWISESIETVNDERCGYYQPRKEAEQK